MITKIQKWGNSLAVRIPRSLAQDTQLGSGKDVEMIVRAGQIVITPTKAPKLKLSDLLKDVTPRNRHAEIRTGASVGTEAW